MTAAVVGALVPAPKPTLVEAIELLRALPAWEEAWRRSVTDDGLPGFEDFIRNWRPATYIVGGEQLRAWLAAIDVVLEDLAGRERAAEVAVEELRKGILSIDQVRAREDLRR